MEEQASLLRPMSEIVIKPSRVDGRDSRLTSVVRTLTVKGILPFYSRGTLWR